MREERGVRAAEVVGLYGRRRTGRGEKKKDAPQMKTARPVGYFAVIAKLWLLLVYRRNAGSSRGFAHG